MFTILIYINLSLSNLEIKIFIQSKIPFQLHFTLANNRSNNSSLYDRSDVQSTESIVKRVKYMFFRKIVIYGFNEEFKRTLAINIRINCCGTY